MMRIAVLLALSLVSIPARAFDPNLDYQLATILGSEEACGLKYDQSAIESFINKNVDPKDMSFAGSLVNLTNGVKFQIQSMSESSLTAHCTQIRRVAKQYGFVK
jgi:hypothetical protein